MTPESSSRSIHEGDVEAIALGATVLGTGGGGDPRVGTLIAKRMLRRYGAVKLITVSELSPKSFVVPIGGIGSPSVDVEKIMADTEIDDALHALEAATGRKIDAIMPIEVGGGNSMVPLAAAARWCVPLVDGDAMGRAFPEAHMVTFHLAGYGPGTTVLVDSFGNTVVSRPIDGPWSERIARVLTAEMGGAATMVDYAFDGEIVRECAIPGTLSTAQRVGEILLGYGAGSGVRDDSRIDAICTELGGRRLFEGKLGRLDRRIENGFTRGYVELAGLGAFQGTVSRLDFQNEFLLARLDNIVIAATPDLIVALDQDNGMPITTEALHYGMRVVVMGIPCDERWRTPVGLETAGPRHFGYDVDWSPVEAGALWIGAGR